MPLAVAAAVLGALWVLVGPWPAYRHSHFERRSYYLDALRAIEVQAPAARSPTSSSAALSAGWSAVPLQLPAGVPLAGYGERRGLPSTGAREPLRVKALALETGGSCAVIVGSDLLMVPENVARQTRIRVAAELGLSEGALLFGASHTHSGPGAGTPGLLARLFAGRYRREVEQLVVEAFVQAVEEAWRNLAPAEICWGSLGVPELIRNRTREVSVAPFLVDDSLDYVAVRRPASAKRCLLVRYSAHATVIGGNNMELAGDFPGALQRTLEQVEATTGIYMAGATGSMEPNPPPGGDEFVRARLMGEALADRVLQDLAGREQGEGGPAPWRRTVELRSLGVPLRTPPLQLRIAPGLRLSPLLLRCCGLSRRGWISAVAVDELLLVGLPCDLSGELSVRWKQLVGEGQPAARALQLVTTSFNGAYVGYVSPDAYYEELYDAGGLAYETGLMSWCGPDQEAYFTAILLHVVSELSA
jgi:neutral ceramidase